MGKGNPLDIEEALECAGSWGLYQKLLYTLLFFAAIPNSFIAMHFVFSHYEPSHHCTFPGQLANFTTNNTEELDAIIETVIPNKTDENGNVGLDGCRIYDRNYSTYPVEEWPILFNYTTETTGCRNGMVFNITPDQNSAVLEYSMICDQDWKAPLATSMYHAGLLVGSLFTTTADRYGRRPIFLLACLLQVLSQILCAASWSFASYCASIFISGVSGIVNFVIPFVLLTEVTGSEWRNFMAIGSTYAFSVGYCIIAPIGYLFQKWRWCVGFMTITSVVIYLPNYWLLPESPRWLAQRGKGKEAMKGLRVMARMNGRKDAFQETLETRGDEIIAKNDITSTGVVESLRVLLKSGIAGRFLAAAFSWLVSASVYYAISYYSSDFSDNRFLNVLFGGLTDLPGILLGHYCVKIIGRPRSMLLLMSICGLSSVCLPFLPKDVPALVTITALVGKGAIAGVFYLAYLVSSEVVPTLQRSSSMGLCSATARIGSFSVPYLMYIRKFNYFVPNLILGALAFSCGLAGIIFLPETKGVDMPDTADEAKDNNRFYGWNLCRNFDEDNKSGYKIGRKSANDSTTIM